MTEPITIQPTTDPDALHAASELRISLFRLIRRLRTEHPTGLKSFAQMAVLMRIYRHGPATLSELAAADGITPQSMARTVGELVDDGLLRREADPSDGRQVLLSLTAAAHALVQDFQSERDNWLARTMLERLSPEERDLMRVASRLFDRLSAE